ncbi:MAG TPA: sigma factor-like helix-turn-helix DNA-binding protein [Pseudonocardiaceae bacterium]|jgi:DNA-directed RNA polymerase specialized sigma24 family protein|nr:sigma factor-like helix-turn-helix DNA-binding protein [Pseudonocardiaceae bacterium]
MSGVMSDRPDDDPTARPADGRLCLVQQETGISDELASDAQLIEFYRNLNFHGREWDDFVSDLHFYGITRISALLASGAIFSKASKLTRRKIWHTGGRIQDRDRQELVSDSVEAALRAFTAKGIQDGGWSPSGGASLNTYFINACVISFTDVYKAWRKAQLNHLPEVALAGFDEVEARAVAATYGPNDADLELLNTAMDRMAKDEIDIFTDIAQGYTYEEIAAKLGKSERAIEGRIYRVRQKLRDLRPANWGRA